MPKRSNVTSPRCGGDVPPFLAGGGEMGARIRAMDWSKTPLGSTDTWPQSLRTCVRIILTSRQPMFLWWGEQLINLYNDAYKAIVGGKHPGALGQPACDVWREIWDQIGPRAEATMRGNEGTYDEALLLMMERYGYREETYYTFSYSPVPDDDGGTAGIICANTDDTQRILGERRLALLRDLAARTADARTRHEACVLSAGALATNGKDAPFALIYLADAEGQSVSLACEAGIQRGHRAAPEHVDLRADSVWPFAEVLRTSSSRVLELDPARFGDLPTGVWRRPPTHAVAVPMSPPGQTGRAGVLIVGLNPFRPFDEQYRTFLGLVARQISSSIANAQAYAEEKKRAETLAELDRAKTAFFGNISHELRTPLTLMLPPIEDALASAGAALPRETLEMVHRNGTRLLKLVNALLDFSRIESGRMAASYEPTDLAPFTADLASAFRSAIERAGLAYEVDCAPLPEPIFVDHDMWEKIVLNLLSNALKFTFEGKIALSLRWVEGRVELSVRDTGTGIPEHERPHVFERFHRVQGARARTHEGSGIGLALVSELVRLHHGAIRVDSEVGVGTTFTITIPSGNAHLPAERLGAKRTLASTATRATVHVQEALRWLPEAEVMNDGDPHAPQASAAVRAFQFGASPSARILLADDNADMREYVARLLRARWTVDAVPDGAAALELARSNPPDLVLTDVMMPNLDGFGLLRALRQDPMTKGIPVIMLSARAGDEARVDGLEAGADDYLVKPFSARELVARVATHLQITAERSRLLVRERDLRNEAQLASRMKDEFLATVSHELRTPLNAILGWTVALRAKKPPEDIDRVLGIVERNARAQARLIEDVLDISRIISGKLRLELGPTNLGAVVSAAVESARPAADAKGVQLTVTVDDDAGVLLADPDRLQQVVWNLVSNAVKFTPKGGSVEVRAVCDDSHVIITVRDTGPGIRPELLPHVFQPFFQADASTTRRHGGLGLGLAIVRQLVHAHGGHVYAESEGPGLGSKFTIELPRTSVPVVAADPALRPEYDSAPPGATDLARLDGLRVLVVDDELDARELLVAMLGDAGAQVVAAGSAVDALEALGRVSPNVIVSDIGMPNVDGYSLLRKIRTLPGFGDTPAIALTAYARGEDERNAMAAGFQRHIAKPVEPRDLIMAVASLALPVSEASAATSS